MILMTNMNQALVAFDIIKILMLCHLFQYAILLTMVVTTIMKYALHTIDLHRANLWENKTVYLLYTELVTGKKSVIFPILYIHCHHLNFHPWIM